VVRAWQGAEPATTENEHAFARFRSLRVVVRAWQGAEPATTENERMRACFRWLWVVVKVWQGAEPCNVPLHHRSGPRLKPLPRYPQPAPRAKLSVRLSTSHYVIVPFFPIVIYVSHYVTVPIVSIIPRFYCTRPIVFS